MCSGEQRQLRRQHHRAKPLGRPNTHQASQAFVRRGCSLLHRAKGLLHPFDLRLQAAPRFGQPVPARLSCKQGRAHVFFKSLNTPRNRGVVHAQAARGTYQRACTGQLQKITQVVPIHDAAPLQ